MLQRLRALLPNCPCESIPDSSGAGDDPNGKAQLARYKTCGFRSDEAGLLILYHSRGDLPEHSLARRFC